MNRWVIVVGALAVGLAGCSKKDVASAPAPVAGAKAHGDAMLAYSHYMVVNLPWTEMASHLEAVRTACVNNAHGACNVLGVEQSKVRGSITVRVVPEGVEPLASLAGRGGKISTRQTTAEDISDAVHDTQRDRDELEAYARRLDEIAARKDLSVTDLIAVAKEQAGIAEKRRALETTAAGQKQRLDTNRLQITFYDPHAREDRPEFGDIGSDMVDRAVEGTSEALELLAESAPFLVLAFPLALVWWGLWRKATRRWRKPGVN
jgi:hypothetical protein